MYRNKTSDSKNNFFEEDDDDYNTINDERPVYVTNDSFSRPSPLVSRTSQPNHNESLSSISPRSNHPSSRRNSLVFSNNFRPRRLSGSLSFSYDSTEILDDMALSPPSSPTSSNRKPIICAHAFPYVANHTSDESLPAYIAKFPAFFYDHVYTTSKKFGGIPLSYLTHKKSQERSQRRYSLLKSDGTPFATGKWPPIKSKTNPIGSMCTGHIPFDAFLQANISNPLDNNIPGSLPLEIKDYPPDPQLTNFYKKSMSADIEGVWLFTEAHLLCVAKRLPEFIEVGDKKYEPTGKMCPFPKIGIQEAERLYSIFDKMKAPHKIYEFMYATDDELIFLGPGSHVYRVDLTKLIVDTEELYQEQKKFINLEDFEAYIRAESLEKAHAPIFRLNEAREYEPVLVWCGPNGPVTGDADPNQIPIPFNMTRIASWGIFNGVESEPSKFINGLKFLLARFQCTTREEFVEYLDTCYFNVEDYLPKEELEYIRNSDSNYLNYIDPEFSDYAIYQEYIAATKSALIKFEKDPSLLKLVCETDFHSIVIQEAMKDKLSYHAGEDLNPYAGDIGVVLIADEAEDHSFIITENPSSYLAYLFSDPKILARWKFSVNSFWLGNRESNIELRSQWLDVIEIQALNHAKISQFEFKMYWQNIVKIIDRHRPGTTEIRPADQVAIDAVNDMLGKIATRIYNPTVINDRLKEIYLKHEPQALQLKMTIVNSKLNIKLNSRGRKFSLE